MTTKGLEKAVTTNHVLPNGNADFWSAHPAAERMGGTVTETETGIFIQNADIYNFENISLDKVDIRIEKVLDDAGDFFAVIAYEPGTNEEYLYDETADTLTEAFDVLADFAPVPKYLDQWNASDLAQFGDIAEYFNNCMVITNFKWIDDDRGISSVGQLAIYAHRHRPADVASDSPDHFFSVYHTFNGGANVIDMQFTDFAELLHVVEKHSEIQEILSFDRHFNS